MKLDIGFPILKSNWYNEWKFDYSVMKITHKKYANIYIYQKYRGIPVLRYFWRYVICLLYTSDAADE